MPRRRGHKKRTLGTHLEEGGIGPAGRKRWEHVVLAVERLQQHLLQRECQHERRFVALAAFCVQCIRAATTAVWILLAVYKLHQLIPSGVGAPRDE
eukprot:5115077-Prymnesium_polylepis.2